MWNKKRLFHRERSQEAGIFHALGLRGIRSVWIRQGLVRVGKPVSNSAARTGLIKIDGTVWFGEDFLCFCHVSFIQRSRFFILISLQSLSGGYSTCTWGEFLSFCPTSQISSCWCSTTHPIIPRSASIWCHLSPGLTRAPWESEISMSSQSRPVNENLNQDTLRFHSHTRTPVSAPASASSTHPENEL